MIGMQTMYQIQKSNTSASSLVDFVARKVAKNWIYLEKDGEIAKKPRDIEQLNKVKEYFSTPTFQNFKNDYFTHYFAGGEVYISQIETLGWSMPYVVDNRTMVKETDSMWFVVWYKQNVLSKSKSYTLKDMYNHIIRKDQDKPYYGISKYFSIVWDALSSTEISKRNYYFFQNNARPDLVVTMENMPGVSTEEYKATLERFEQKYSWSKNSHKTITSNLIKDVKVLEMNHKDLQLLELDVLTMKKMGMLFGIDPRLLGFSDDVGAYATMNEIGKHSLAAISAYQLDFEGDINNIYKLFIDPSFPYTIKCDGETFEDRKVIEESQRKDLELWILTIEEVRSERWLDIKKIPEQAKQHLIKNNVLLLSSLTETQTWTANSNAGSI